MNHTVWLQWKTMLREIPLVAFQRFIQTIWGFLRTKDRRCFFSPEPGSIKPMCDLWRTCAHKFTLTVIFTTDTFWCTLLKNDLQEAIKEKYFSLINEVSCSKLAGHSCLRFLYVSSVSQKCYRANMMEEYVLKLYDRYFGHKLPNEYIHLSVN